MDDQSLSGMRICVQILLRAVHARIHGVGRRRVREEDLCEEGCGGAAGAGCVTEVFLRVGEVTWGETGPYRDWDSDGSVPAGRAGIWSDTDVPGGACKTRGDEHFDHHEVEPDCAGHRCAEADCRALFAANRYHGDDAAAEAGAITGAPCTTAEIAAPGGEGIAGGGIGRRCFCIAAVAGDYGWRRRARSGGGRCKGSGRAVVFLGSAVSDAIVGEAIFAVCAREVSAAGETISAVVCEKRLRARTVPAQGFRAGGAVAAGIWL